MTPAETSEPSPPPTSLKELGWKELALRWLFSQGTSTVLLFAIALGGWLGIPAELKRQETERQRVEAANEAERQRMYLAYELERKETRAEFKAELKETRTDFKAAITELGDAIKDSARRSVN